MTMFLIRCYETDKLHTMTNPGTAVIDMYEVDIHNSDILQ